MKTIVEKVRITHITKTGVFFSNGIVLTMDKCVGWRWLTIPKIGDEADIVTLEGRVGNFAVKCIEKPNWDASWYFLAFVLGCIVWYFVERYF
jgi:hypothetical protein